MLQHSNFVVRNLTENDTKVSAAVAMFQGTPDPPPPESRLRRYLFPFLIN